MVWDKTQDWFWEGNVQDKIAAYMEHGEGFQILEKADTLKKEHGPDILAEKNSIIRRVAVKGYPSDKYVDGHKAGQKKPTTRPQNQAQKWLAGGIFEIVKAKSKDKEIEIALGLPKIKTYEKHIENLNWFINKISLHIYFVDENGQVELHKG